MTLSGRCGIRCSTLPRRAGPNRQIINCEERCQLASFRPFWPFRNLLQPMASSGCLEPLVAIASSADLEIDHDRGNTAYRDEGRLLTSSRTLGSFRNLTHTMAPSGDLGTDHDHDTQHMEKKVVYRPPRYPTGRFKTSQKQ